MAMRHPLPIAFSGFLGWMLITVGGDYLQTDAASSLEERVTGGLLYPVALAALFVVLIIHLNGWWKDVGLRRPQPARSMLLWWFPAVYLLPFLYVGLQNTLPPGAVLLHVVVNTAMVGISEELAFRGMLWSRVRQSLAFWPGFALVSTLFGLIHVLNGFLTGDWPSAVIQAASAAASGAGYLALRIRNRSLLPIIVFHALWDMTLFLVSASAGTVSSVDGGFLSRFGQSMVLAVPMLLYGLFLVRNERVRSEWRNDAPIPTLGS